MAKVKIIKKTAQDKELLNAFNQMIGNGDIDPTIVSGKYENLYTQCTNCLIYLGAFAQQILPKVFKDYTEQFGEITAWVARNTSALVALKIKKLENLTPEQILAGDIYNRDELKAAYNELKGCQLTKELLDIYIYLLPYRRHIESETALSWGFILTSPGSDFSPFAFSYLNLKELAGSSKMNEDIRKYILTILHILFKSCATIYDLITSPDINVDRMVELLIENLKKVRGQIPDCDLAFKKLESSVELLRNNFGKYYNECVTSDNPSAIMENFINDVASETKADGKMMRQFHRIIAFYQKNLQGKINDPKLREMYDTVNKKYKDIENILKKKGQGGEKDGAEKDDDREEKNDDESDNEDVI